MRRWVATSALAACCLFALDSDAHTTTQLSYADTALALARVAASPTERIVNYWPLDDFWFGSRIHRPSVGHE